MKAFGNQFIIINDIQQRLNPRYFGGGNWLHLATVQRGFKEYMAFKKIEENKIYIEEIDPSLPGLFKRIEEDSEWSDLKDFLTSAGLLKIGVNHEFKVAK